MYDINPFSQWWVDPLITVFLVMFFPSIPSHLLALIIKFSSNISPEYVVSHLYSRYIIYTFMDHFPIRSYNLATRQILE